MCVNLACIGVFDSGVGGLTVAAALRQALPSVDLHYVADSAHAPYGERDAEFIQARSLTIAGHLRDKGARLLVMACNTATAHAAQVVRERFPDLPVVGIEPGVKPAVLASRNGRVGVLATTATVHSARFKRLLETHAAGAQVLAVACTGLVAAIEAGELDSPTVRELVERYSQQLRDAGVDTALLACTHYPLLMPLWQAALPGVSLLRIEPAVALQAKRLWAWGDGAAKLTLESTGDPELLRQMAGRALGIAPLSANFLTL